MDDGSSSILKSLKNDWALLWGSFSEGSSPSASVALAAQEKIADLDLGSEDLQKIDPQQLEFLSRHLSQRRKILNQKLESLNREIEMNSTKLETVRLVGGEEEEILNRISVLTDLGTNVNAELSKLDEKLSFARKKEQELMLESTGE